MGIIQYIWFIRLRVLEYIDVSTYVNVMFLTAIALMMEAISTSETSVDIYQTTRRNIPEDSHLQEFRGCS
jgi:hypothetical protein